jgi:hypothetical protein
MLFIIKTKKLINVELDNAFDGIEEEGEELIPLIEIYQ